MAAMQRDLDGLYRPNHIARQFFNADSRRDLLEQDLEAAKYVRLILVSILALGTFAGALMVYWIS